MASKPFQLVMRKGPNPGKTFELVQDEVVIGRDIGNRVVINDPEVSRKHTRLTLQANGYVVEDMGSTNGTFVDGQRLMGPHLLRPGETIMLGEKISFSFEAVGYDTDATLPQVSPPTPLETYRVPPPSYEPAPPPAYHPPPPPVYQTPLEYQPSPPPAFSGQVPPGPAEPYIPPAEPYAMSMEEEPRKKKTWLYVGCGCLIVVLCCLVFMVVAYQFDTLDLYCEPPFDTLFSWLWNCP